MAEPRRGEVYVALWTIILGSLNDVSGINYSKEGKGKGPFTNLEWPRGFQEVKARRLHDNGTGLW